MNVTARFSEAMAYYNSCLQNLDASVTPDGQKFPIGTRVRVSDVMPKSMSHFSGAGRTATVEYTYAQMYGGSDVKSYSLVFDDGGSSAWYPEELLTEIT